MVVLLVACRGESAPVAVRRPRLARGCFRCRCLHGGSLGRLCLALGGDVDQIRALLNLRVVELLDLPVPIRSLGR
jgi:hypothetical protein